MRDERNIIVTHKERKNRCKVKHQERVTMFHNERQKRLCKQKMKKVTQQYEKKRLRYKRKKQCYAPIEKEQCYITRINQATLRDVNENIFKRHERNNHSTQ